MKKLRVVILKPSKYNVHGPVERFRRGFMPNSTVPYLRSMTPLQVDGVRIETLAIDEYVQTDLQYLRQLHKADTPTLLALVGVQSHQFQRSLDLTAYALDHGVEHCVIGGPHPMTCDTSVAQNRGVSFAVSEAETIWMTILKDAISGELQPVYGAGQRWQKEIQSPVLIPPAREDMRRYVLPMLGIYPARGCPFTCNFCSVIKIAGREIRSQDIETTMASLRAAKSAGVKMILFTSDNFNKYPDAAKLLQAMIDERILIPFMIQCDTQIVRQAELVELLSRAGCTQMFVGVESFSRQTLLQAHKAQNHPELYRDIVRLCRNYGISTHFSNIIGFPQDTAAGVEEHLATLVGMQPDLASFYILTPIPGTQQYDEFLSRGLIYEQNLDRFDATRETWHHEHFREGERRRLLFECYRRFYSVSHLVKTQFRARANRGSFGVRALEGLGLFLFSQYSAFAGIHPMSGGIGRVVRDTAQDYRDLRRKRFGFDLAPLPQSLQLSAEEMVINNRVRVS